MTYLGHVSNGVIVLEGSVTLPEGLGVKVEPIAVDQNEVADEDIPSFYERLKPLIGKAVGLPPDASVNHDHYLYGVPKQEE
jgi:hypothetical protein